MKLEISGGSPVMQQNQQVHRQQQRPMMQHRLPKGMAGNNINKIITFVPNKAANNSAATKIVAQAVLRRAKRNFGVQKQLGERIVKSKMMKEKMVALDSEQLDADLEAYTASKD